MTVKADGLYLVTITDKLFKIDTKTGKALWSYDAEKSVSSLVVSAGASPLVVGDKLYMGSSDGQLLCFSLRSGALIWKVTLSTSSYQFKDVVGKLSYFQNKIIATLYDGTVLSVYDKGSKGEVLWKKSLTTITTSDLFDKLLFVGFMNGDVGVYNPESGERLSSVNIGQAVTTISSSRTNIYVTGAKGRIASVNVKKGKIDWVDDVGASLAFKPIMWKDNLYFPSDLNVFYGYQIN